MEGRDTDPAPFRDLPAALVDDVLNATAQASERLLDEFRRTYVQRSILRNQLRQAGLVQHESSLGYPSLPSTCATDGSYAIDRLLTADLAAAAAVAVEGLTPPKERRFWPEPHHSTFVAVETHDEDTGTILRAVMLGRELVMADQAPHTLVMFDGTLTLPLIYFNQALARAPGKLHLLCARELLDHVVEYLQAYAHVLQGTRSDRQAAGLPKYSTRREIGRRLGWPIQADDRGLLTLLLEPGELTRPQPLERPDQPWHLGVPDRLGLADLARQIVQQIGQVHVFYYKPQDWLPALRVEVAAAVARNPHRLAIVVQGIKHQCPSAGIFEPYPVYLADRTVKALARSLPTFRQVTTQRLGELYEGNLADIFFAMHGYRTESGQSS